MLNLLQAESGKNDHKSVKNLNLQEFNFLDSETKGMRMNSLQVGVLNRSSLTVPVLENKSKGSSRRKTFKNS